MAWPPERKASEAQMKLIFFLLRQLGYDDPRTDTMIRREYGLTQKQARGNFTFPEASRFIDQLKADLERVGGEIQPEELRSE